MIDIEDLFNSEVLDERPEITINEVNYNVNHFVENYIIPNKPNPIYRLGRKAHHLIIHLQDRLSETNFVPLSIRKYATIYFSDSFFLDESYIFCDSIHYGGEILGTLRAVNESINCTKIFSYICNEEGVNRIKQTEFKDIPIVGLFNCDNEDDYQKEFTKLRVYFMNRIEPMDIDYFYDIYNLKENINCAFCASKIEAYLSTKFELVGSAKYDKSLKLSDNIYQCYFSIKNNFKQYKTLQNIIDKLEFEFFSVELKLKFKINEYDTTFSITPIIRFPSVPTTKRDENGECIFHNENCLYEIVTKTETLEDKLPGNLCSWCVERVLGHLILDVFEENVVEAFKSQKLSIEKTRSYRPFYKM